MTASAPGSLMLMGEHAVLHGHRALCAAVDTRMRVRLTHRPDDRILIRSALGELDVDRHDLSPVAPFQFVLTALMRHPPVGGLELDIEADFSSTVGFGSSSAVTVATLAALRASTGNPMDRDSLFRDSRDVIRQVQGRGSGADAAAATFGGIVAYRADPVEIETLSATPDLSVHYAGYKTPTPEVVRQVERRRQQFPALFEQVFTTMDAACGEAVEAIRRGDLPRLGALFDLHHGLQDTLGTCDGPLAELVYGLRRQPGVLGAKISGSGLGDCVIALGPPNVECPPYTRLPATLSPTGVLIEN